MWSLFHWKSHNPLWSHKIFDKVLSTARPAISRQDNNCKLLECKFLYWPFERFSALKEFKFSVRLQSHCSCPLVWKCLEIKYFYFDRSVLTKHIALSSDTNICGITFCYNIRRNFFECASPKKSQIFTFTCPYLQLSFLRVSSIKKWWCTYIYKVNVFLYSDR